MQPGGGWPAAGAARAGRGAIAVVVTGAAVDLLRPPELRAALVGALSLALLSPPGPLPNFSSSFPHFFFVRRKTHARTHLFFHAVVWQCHGKFNIE